MKPLCIVAALVLLCLLTSLTSIAQDAASGTPEIGVVLVKLSPPVYPPLARQARIMGDVKLYIHVRKDGSVESTELFSGHPVLAPAALESARKSHFECRGCGDEISSYPMTYTFGFFDQGPKETVEERPIRTAKCLYFWKCGIRRISIWQCSDNRPAETTESKGHVTILASTPCLQTETATEANLALRTSNK